MTEIRPCRCGAIAAWNEWARKGKRMTKHRLKLDTIYYQDSATGIKTFEIRKNDRDFRVGDILELREWIWSNLEKKGTYTGNAHWKIITYILDDVEYLRDDYVCLGVSPIAEPSKEGETK